MTARREYEPYHPVRCDDLPLFQVPIREMARRDSPATSKAAAIAISDRLTELQQRVLGAFQAHVHLTGKELEQLPELADLGFSTARKRLSECANRGWLRQTGETRDGCAVYEAVR